MMGLKLSSNKIVLATNNKHKVEEISAVLKELFKNETPKIEIITLNDLGIDFEIEEDGETLEENAFIKAKTINEKTGLPTLADDTGLEVLVLNNRPGVYSARYAGSGCNYVDNCKKILKELGDKPHRNAVFRTIMCFVDNMWVISGEGRVDGEITLEFRGKNGFGYDPIFQISNTNQTYAELTKEEKNNLSHRALALKDLIQRIENL